MDEIERRTGRTVSPAAVYVTLRRLRTARRMRGGGTAARRSGCQRVLSLNDSAIGAGSFAFLYASLHPTLPLHDGERIVGLENWDVDANTQEDRNLHDFMTWRNELKSVEDLGAFLMIARNLITPDGHAEPVSVAEMTASGFRVARVPPLLGICPAQLVEGPTCWHN